MPRLRVCVSVVIALAAPGALAAGGSAITADTYSPAAQGPASSTLTPLLESMLSDPRGATPTSPEIEPGLHALLDPSGATFSPRPMFVVRPEVAPSRRERRDPNAPVPAPGAVGLLALAGACAVRRRAR